MSQTLYFLCTQARKEFLQQAARAWHSEQEAEKHSLLLDFKFKYVINDNFIANSIEICY
jgi:hypothetical protein